MGENNKMGMIIALVAIVAVLVGGVAFFTGSDDENDDTSETAQSQQSPASDDAMSAEPSSNIVELAQGTESLSTLVTAVVQASLVDTLSGAGPFTVFAPTNEAFAALPEGTLEDLLMDENVDQLSSILTYHVVAAEAMSGDLSDGQKITTVQGDELTVSIEGGVVKINDATVVSADIEASNGVVHVIDTVLLP